MMARTVNQEICSVIFVSFFPVLTAATQIILSLACSRTFSSGRRNVRSGFFCNFAHFLFFSLPHEQIIRRREEAECIKNRMKVRRGGEAHFDSITFSSFFLFFISLSFSSFSLSLLSLSFSFIFAHPQNKHFLVPCKLAPIDCQHKYSRGERKL